MQGLFAKTKVFMAYRIIYRSQWVQYVSTTGKTNPCTRSNTQKKYFEFFNASDQAELRPNPSRTRHQAGPWCTQLQILDPRVKISKFKIPITFWISTSQKGAFCQIVKKSPEFYSLKNLKKEPIAVFFYNKKKERQRQPAPPTPKRSKKSILIFANFFRFLCQAPRCGSKVHKTHRSEVNIKRRVDFIGSQF